MASPLNSTGFAPIKVSSWADEEEDVPMNTDRSKPAIPDTIPEGPGGVQMPGPHAVVIHGIPSNWVPADVGHLFSGLMVLNVYPHPSTHPGAIMKSFVVDFKEDVDLQWALSKPPNYHGKTFPVRPYHETSGGMSRGRPGPPLLVPQHSDRYPYREGPSSGGSLRGPHLPGSGSGGGLLSHPSAPVPWDGAHCGEHGSGFGWAPSSRSAAVLDHRGPIGGGVMRSTSDLRGPARSDAESTRWTHHPQAGITSGLHSLTGVQLPPHAAASSLVPAHSTESMHSADRQLSAGLEPASSASISAPGIAAPASTGTAPAADSPAAAVAASVQPRPRANPFGAAKPVDTASKLREIEEKAAAQRKEAEEAARREAEIRAKAEAEAREKAEAEAREKAEAEAAALKREEEARAAAVAHAQAQALAAAAAAPAAMAMQRAVHDLAAANPQALCFGEIGPEYQPAPPQPSVMKAALPNGQPGSQHYVAPATTLQPHVQLLAKDASDTQAPREPPPPPPAPLQRNTRAGSMERRISTEAGYTDATTNGLLAQPPSSSYSRGAGGRGGRGRGVRGYRGRGPPSARVMSGTADAEHPPMPAVPPPPPPPPPPMDAPKSLQTPFQQAAEDGSHNQQQPARELGHGGRGGRNARGGRGRGRGRAVHTVDSQSAAPASDAPFYAAAGDQKQQQPRSDGVPVSVPKPARAEATHVHASLPHTGGRRGGRGGRGDGVYGRRGGPHAIAGDDGAAQAAAASAAQAMTDLPSATSVSAPDSASAQPSAGTEAGAPLAHAPVAEHSQRRPRYGSRGGRGRAEDRGAGHIAGTREPRAGHVITRGADKPSHTTAGAPAAAREAKSAHADQSAAAAVQEQHQQHHGAASKPLHSGHKKSQEAAPVPNTEPIAGPARSTKPGPGKPAAAAEPQPTETRAQSLFRKFGSDSKGPGPAKLKNTFALLAEAADD